MLNPWIRTGNLKDNFSENGEKKVVYENTASNRKVRSIKIAVSISTEMVIVVHTQDLDTFKKFRHLLHPYPNITMDECYLKFSLLTREIGNVGILLQHLVINEPEYKKIKEEVRNTLNFVYNDIKLFLAPINVPQMMIMNFNHGQRPPTLGTQSVDTQNAASSTGTYDSNTVSSVWRRHKIS